MLETAELEPKKSIFDSCVLLSFTVHVIGNSAKGDIGEIQTEGDKSMLRLTKQLLDCEEYEELSGMAAAIRETVKRKCLGGKTENYKAKDGSTRQVGSGLQSLIKRGCYLVPLTIVENIEQTIAEAKPKFRQKVTKFCEVYESAKEKAQERLGPQFNEKDYDSLEEVKAKCRIAFQYLSIGVPENLKSVKPELFERERNKAKQAWAEASQEITAVMRAAMKNLTDHLLDRLAVNGDGKKKKFHDSAIDKLKEFLTDFPGKNITNDEQLSELVLEAKKIIGGKGAKELRKDEDYKERILTKLGKVKSKLDDLMEDTPCRVIKLED